MYPRRRALSAGAVLTAAGAIVLSGSPAQADCSLANGAENSRHWQVGAQLGTAPVSLTGEGGLPALLLSALPESRIAVKGVGGRNLVRVDATSVRAGTESASLPDTFPAGLHPAGLDLAPIDGVRVLETDRAGAAKPAPGAALDQAVQPAAPALRSTSAGQWEVLRADDRNSALGGEFAWVPIEGLGGLGADGTGLPWVAVIALVALAGGTAAVTVVRHRRLPAG